MQRSLALTKSLEEREEMSLMKPAFNGKHFPFGFHWWLNFLVIVMHSISKT
jgi:hypothetical protein